MFNGVRRVLIGLSPGAFDRLYYRMKLGRPCNLKEPRRLSEKIMWLKQNWFDQRAVCYADKYAVRAYLQEKGYGDLLIPLLAVYTDPADFKPEELPRQFVLKAAHGSGMNFICQDRDRTDLAQLKKTVKKWLRTNYYYQCAERHYDQMPRRVVCEELVVDPGQKSLTEYKIMCYHGIPKQIFVYYDRGDHSATSCCYDPDWQQIPVHSGIYDKSEKEIPQPRQLKRMLEIARELSKDFPLLRVDLYEVQGKLYFGELTFFHNAGVCRFEPDQYDRIFGEQLQLPMKTGGTYG